MINFFVYRHIADRILHQSHTENDDQRRQRYQGVNGNAVEHGSQSCLFKIGKAGVKPDGGKCGDH